MKRLLIANRGEIALRVMRTARRVGLETVAIYSDADADAPHVQFADHAVRIGPAPVRDSYLNMAAVLDAVRTSGADAVHPGYGFMSENVAFAQSLADMGVVFVGPPASAIEAMGLKDAAKQLMRAAGVPVTPGYDGDDQSDARLAAAAGEIGYPVLIKAVAGGGGKGMRRVDDPADFAEALRGAQREGLNAFGDGRVLIEKYILNPRHIEVQVFGDSHGQIVHLFERDCSVQRRHQKVIEEAPAPGMTDAVRARVCAAAVAAARAVGYVGAGTVEFIADGSGALDADRIWFMEMNTRLQVEHPVTEMITGVDLVEWQLRVAAGEPLPARQEQITMRGHAMEARLYAENPQAGFLPSTGRLEVLSLPDEIIRIDAGVSPGGVISPHYDPMIAKLISHGMDRGEARQQLSEAVAMVCVAGVRTNAGFLVRCLNHPAFAAGGIDTGFIAAHLDDLLPSGGISLPQVALAAAFKISERLDMGDSSDPWDGLDGFRLNAPAQRREMFAVDGQAYDVVVSERRITINGDAALQGGNLSLDSQTGLWRLVTDQGVVTARLVQTATSVHLFDHGSAFTLSAPDHRAAAGAGGGDGVVLAPMPGKILDVRVQAGQSVRKGEVLLILEAMKMEHSLTAGFDGIVAELSAETGGQTTEGAILARLTPA